MNTLSKTQFVDLALYIINNGQFSSFPGLNALSDCEEIYEHGGLAGYSDVIFLKDGQPYALYENFNGFQLLNHPQPEPLTETQFADLAVWISENGSFSETLPGDALEGCELLELPCSEEDAIHADQIFIRNGCPVAMQRGEAGFYSLA